MDASLVGESLFHFFSGNFRKWGPVHQVSFFMSSWMEHPWEGKSVGFNSQGQCLHWCFFFCSRISLTQCWTYCFQVLLFLIWHNVVNKSVHSVTAGVTLGDVEVCKMESVNLASFFFCSYQLQTRLGLFLDWSYSGLGSRKADFDFIVVFYSNVNDCCQGIVWRITEGVKLIALGLHISAFEVTTGYSNVL